MNKITKLSLIGLFALAPLSNSWAATYYVDSVAGVDSNNGTSSSTPWKSLAKVNSVTFQPGDNVLFKRGCTWTGTLVPRGSGTSAAQLTFDAYGTAPSAPVIDGNGLGEAVWLINKRYFTFQNFSVTNNASSEGKRIGILVEFEGAPAPAGVTTFPGVRILNNEIHHVKGNTIRTWVYETAALFIRMKDTNGAQTLVQDLLIQNNEFYNNWCIGLYMQPPANYVGRQDLWATNVRIADNTFTTGGADHIIVQGANAPVIEYNAGFDAGLIESPNANSFIAGMWSCYSTRDCVFQFNEVARTRNGTLYGLSGDSQAFDADLGTHGNQIFQYNYTHDNDGGVLIMMAEDVPKTVIYRYNLSVNDARNTNSGCQFSVLPSSGTNSAQIYNNVLYSNRQEGFKFMDRSAAYYYNNIFSMPSAIYPSKPTFSNNCYFGHDPDVSDPYKVVADPRFVGPLPTTAGNGFGPNTTDVFKLLSISPCINAGKTIANNGSRDFWGNPLYAGSYPDIGAHEVPGGSRPAPSAVTIVDSTPGSSVVYSGTGWAHSADAVYYNGTKSVSAAVGDYVQYSFTGTNVSLFGRRGPGLGKLNISIDGGAPYLVDTFWAEEQWRKELFQISGLAPGSHTIRATVAAKNPLSVGNHVAIDYFLTEPGTPYSKPFATPVDSSPSASVVYTGTWSHSSEWDVFYGKTNSGSSTIGSYVTFTFTGTGARLFGKKESVCGKLNVSIDGGSPTLVNCFQPTLKDFQVKLFEVTGLPFGTHTLRATVATKDPASQGNNISIDLFHALSGGSLLANPSFEADASGSQTISGWLESGTVAASFVSTTSTAKHGSKYLGINAGTPYSVFTYQTLTGLPNGLYTLKAWTQRDSGGYTAQLEATPGGGASQALTIPLTTSWTEQTLYNVNVTNGSCTVGFRATGAPAGVSCRVDAFQFYRQ